MTNEELLRVESSQRQHHEVLLQQERMCLAVEASEVNLFSILRPKLYQDGGAWCCLYGDDIATGVVGFGDTPYNAILDWNNAWHSNTGAAPQKNNEAQTQQATGQAGSLRK